LNEVRIQRQSRKRRHPFFTFLHFTLARKNTL
jgi:hypothetical protein